LVSEMGSFVAPLCQYEWDTLPLFN
jgi:hypothetical protein